ncbi:formate--phosphoribosylaminoimidazolecarboxamide ligase family protein [Candidatus Borrarchaeum sp.]|uniref:formate--phosphoribosylaminoimidazolecarboxamide ligase family protein n=1 Tax=Candidatus Borrarchaeum sp. TaxID=2846742 RepID=UPI00257BFB7F|nr:formate--phosphoribosylaminoimidazolecarboxamide ligase family protein [Candidatus Borrarchaeum sp.]
MLDRNEILGFLEKYDPEKIAIGCVASHSALDVADGAQDEGFEMYAFCEKGREAPYTRYFKTLYHQDRLVKGVIDYPVVLDSFKELVDDYDDKWLQFIYLNNIVFIPNRSFVVYCGKDEIENNFVAPIVGTRNMLRIEDRESEEFNYYTLAEKAGMRIPEKLDSPEEIDEIGLVMVKLKHAKHRLERGFFTAASFKEYQETSERLLSRGVITKEDLEQARIERYAVGPVFNFDFFYSPVSEKLGEEPLELLGIDWRFESSLDGFVRLPAAQQLTLQDFQKDPVYNVVGHNSCTLRESLLRYIFPEAERFVKATKAYFDPGIIGSFTIQTTIEEDMKPTTYDIAVRIGGGTNVHMYLGHPYGNILWRKRMSSGRRTCLEVKRAIEKDMLDLIVT